MSLLRSYYNMRVRVKHILAESIFDCRLNVHRSVCGFGDMGNLIEVVP